MCHTNIKLGGKYLHRLNILEIVKSDRKIVEVAFWKGHRKIFEKFTRKHFNEYFWSQKFRKFSRYLKIFRTVTFTQNLQCFSLYQKVFKRNGVANIIQFCSSNFQVPLSRFSEHHFPEQLCAKWLPLNLIVNHCNFYDWSLLY